jgi:hypothetical protein
MRFIYFCVRVRAGARVALNIHHSTRRHIAISDFSGSTIVFDIIP